MYSGADGAKRHGRCHADIDARKLTNIRETEKIGHDRLAAAVFVGAVGMQSIAATAGLGIDQRERQVVAAEKPRENAVAIAFHSTSPSARQAVRQAEIVAVASTRLLIERAGGWRRSPKPAVPMGRK